MDGLFWGYLAGMIAGGIVAYISWRGVKADLEFEKRAYVKWNADLDQLFTDILKGQDSHLQLLMAVKQKIPGESRHDTALRIIEQNQNQNNPPEVGGAS